MTDDGCVFTSLAHFVVVGSHCASRAMHPQSDCHIHLGMTSAGDPVFGSTYITNMRAALALLLVPVQAQLGVLAPIDSVFYMTDGECTVGVTDNMCTIDTDIKSGTKKSAGKTYSTYTAMQVVGSLQAHGMYATEPPTLAFTSSVFYHQMCHIYVINATAACTQVVEDVASAYSYTNADLSASESASGMTTMSTLVLALAGIACLIGALDDPLVSA